MSLSLKLLFSGKAPAQYYRIYVFFVLGLYALVMTIAWTFFPIEYSMKHNDISDLGGWAENPNGYWWYNIPVVFIGLFMISLMLYFYHGINKINTKAPLSKYIGGFFTIIAPIFFSLHGIFPQDLGLIHIIIAYSCFITLMIGAIFYLYATFKHFNTQSSNIVKFIFYFINLWLYLAFFGMLIAISVAKINNIPISMIYSSWEWFVMLSMQAWMIISTFLISHEQLKIENRMQISPNSQCTVNE